MNLLTVSLFKFDENLITFPKIKTNAIIKEITTLIEIIEDIWGTIYLSFNLRSSIFIKLQKNSGGYWDNKKFKDYFQINC